MLQTAVAGLSSKFVAGGMLKCYIQIQMRQKGMERSEHFNGIFNIKFGSIARCVIRFANRTKL